MRALGLGIDAGRGLVEQQQLRLGRERARQQHALALARRRARRSAGLRSSSARHAASASCVSSLLARAAEAPERQVAPRAEARHVLARERIERIERLALRHVADAQAGPPLDASPRAAAGGRAGRASAWSCRCRSSRAATTNSLGADLEGRAVNHRAPLVAEVGSFDGQQAERSSGRPSR